MQPTDEARGTRHPELWGPVDIRTALGAKSTRTLHVWRQRADFPKPIATVCGGAIPVWDADEVRAWHEARGRNGRNR